MSTQNQKTIFLFHGEESYSSSQKVKLWKQEFIKKYGEEGVETLTSETLNSSNFETNIETVPFLSEKKLIILKDIFKKSKKEDLEKISKSLEKTPDFCVIIFHENESADKRTGLYKKIQKYGKIEEFKHKSPNEITRWIMDQSRNKDIKITPLTASYLTNHCGIELWKISNELEKLKIYAQNKEITNEMIDNLTTPSITSSIFKLTDKIAEKNTKEALKTLKNLQESGEDITRVFFMIVRHFRILIQAHDLIQKKETQTGIAKRLKQHPFVIQKTSAQSRNFTQEKLEKIYGHLLKIDKDFKTGSIKIIKGDNRAYILAIEKLIIDCCQ